MIKLPIDPFLPKIVETLQNSQNLVITAAPGAGKTTRVPPALLSLVAIEVGIGKKILVLEPRRVAAAAAAARIAEEQNLTLGEEIGYQVRFENVSSQNSKIIFLTEALLAKKIQNDPELRDVGLVVLDEFHERSLATDLAIGLLKELQELSRSDLKIVVMSATMDAQKVSHFLQKCPIMDVPGQIFDMQILYRQEQQLLQTGAQFIDRCVQQIKGAVAGKEQSLAPGHTLVFLPGVGEINRLQEKLEPWAQANDLLVCCLHGSMTLPEQRRVLQASQRKKIILATNVAESALTIDGVNTVIDSGLMRMAFLNSQTGLPSLKLQRIPKSSATQRAGRAARQGPGRVFRLWSKTDEISMPDFELPEISRTDLADVILTLATLQITDFQNFSWYEQPAALRVALATKQLRQWQALDAENKITELGQQMARLPTPARVARFLLAAQAKGCTPFACELAAILLERNNNRLEKNQSHEESDLLLLHDFYAHRPRGNYSRTVEQLQKQLANSQRPLQTDEQYKVLQELLLAAYPDRLCRRRRKGEAACLLIDGKGAELSEHSTVKHAEFFIALELMEGLKSGQAMISLASAVDEQLVRRHFQNGIIKKSEIYFHPEREKLYRKEQEFLEHIPLGEATFLPVTEEEAAQHLPEIALQRFAEILRGNAELLSWTERYAYYAQQVGAPPLAEKWKLAALQEACFAENNFESLKNKSLVSFFESQMPDEQKKDFQQLCPSHLLMPTGSKIQLQYFSDKHPVLEVRLQEVFGWTETPRILNGKIPVTINLLAPNYRPVQMTQDLSSFWKNGYVEVRKELRARYPKHSWPDDPVTAKAVAKGRKRS